MSDFPEVRSEDKVGVEPPIGDATGESSSISTSRGGAEQVLFEASLDGVGGETKFGAASTSHTDSESPEAVVWATKAVSADAIITLNFFSIKFLSQQKRLFCDDDQCYQCQNSHKTRMLGCQSILWAYL
jgi:hypothetical protein